MPDWFTKFHRMFAEKKYAMGALGALKRFAVIAGIPDDATWRVFPRGVGLVVTAKWGYGDPGAVPATEAVLIGGVPVLVEKEGGDEEAA